MFSVKILIFCLKVSDVLYEKSYIIFCMIFLTIHKISCYKERVSMGVVETRWLGDSFLMVYRNNAGRLGSGFISVCLETRWLGHLGGFYVPGRPYSGLSLS